MDAIRRRPDKLVDTSYQPASQTAAAPAKPSTACDYKNDLLIAIIPLLLVLLVFGGRFSILVMCFGGLVCYIFDLIGSMEGTISALIITMLGEVACLVWAARVFISESVYNFSVIILMWIVLVYCFLVSCNYFTGLVNDVGVVLAVMDQLMFATLPLVSASLLSWFLCIEVPSLDLLLCFNGVYFVYVLFLGRPRPISAKKAGSPTSPSGSQRSLLPAHLLILMYMIPIVMTILMHIAIHHNVLSTHHTRVTNFLLSVIVPSLLMTYCAYKQLASPATSFHANDDYLSTNLSKFLEVSTFVLSCALVYCLQSHPLFDELKSFSELSDDVAGAAIMGAVFFVFAAFAIHSFSKAQAKALIEQSEYMNTDSAVAAARLKTKFVGLLASLCIGAANALVCVVIGLPDHALGVSIVGAMALAEYYLHPEWSSGAKAMLLGIASIYSALAAASFIKMALRGIVYNFHWQIDVTLPEFTTLVNVLVPVAVLLPTLLSKGGSAEVVDSLGLGAGGLGSSSNGAAAPQHPSVTSAVGNAVFEWLFPAVVAVVTATELMIREQDWSDIRVSVGVVYPEYYFIGTAAVVLLASVLLFAGDAIGPACLWILLCMQGSKLLHLVGISSTAIATTCLLVLAYTLPFIRTVSKYLRADQENKGGFATPRLGNKNTSSIQTLELLTYVVVATFATYYTYAHSIAHHLLEVVLARDPTALQQVTLCVGVWLAYVACVLVVFYKSAKLIRSVVLVLCGLCLLVALEGFGHLNMTIEQTTSNYLTVSFHPDMAVTEHPVLFFLLTSVLSTLAAVGMIPLHTLLMCILYSALFAFISSKAMLAWAFPLSLSDNTFTHDVLAFPFVYLYVFKFLLTLVAVYNPTLNPKQGRVVVKSNNVTVTQGALVVACALPFFGLLYAISANVYPIAHSGIEWSAIVGFVTLCVTTRLREVYNLTTNSSNGSIGSTYTSNMSASAYSSKVMAELSVCLPCAALAIFWVCFAVFTSHTLDRDVLIPLASLTLLCTTQGSVLRGVSPIVLVGVFCSVFWVLSALYAVLVQNYNAEPTLLNFALSHDVLGIDSDVSIWTNASTFWPLVHLAEVLLPLPGIYAGVVHSYGRSEDVLFVLALCSVVPIFGAQISSLRYLGVVGLVFAAHKGYTLNSLQQRSDLLI